ncbi:MAG: glycosyltransferase family 39 protein [Deltaproteobacteria bacterium]|nr:glycosyltransferase family 39 protein [Deltaproteobacteria bacterium]
MNKKRSYLGLDNFIDKNILSIILLISGAVFIYLIFRNTGLYSLVMGDEWWYSKFSRLIPIQESGISSYIYISIFKNVNYCGDGWYECARILNSILFVAAFPFIYLIARKVCSKSISLFITTLSVLGPINAYTACFMIEPMYFFAFWCFTWVVIEFRKKSPASYGALTGSILGLMSMVKVNAIFLVPGFLLFLLYRSRSQTKPWLKQAITTILFVIVSGIIIRFVIGYIYAGINGLNILGSFYESPFSPDLNILKSLKLLVKLLLKSMYSIKLHLMALSILYGMPLASLIMYKSENSTDLEVERNKLSIQNYTLAILVPLLFVSATFTALVAGGQYESIARVHMRYYNFALPLLYIVAASQLSTSTQKVSFYKTLPAAILIGLTSIYAMMTLTSTYGPYFIDGPELRGITYNHAIFYVLAGLGLFATLVWALKNRLGAQIFIFLFIPLSTIASSYFVNKDLRNYMVPTVYDKAGIFTHEYLDNLGINGQTLAIVGSSGLGWLYKSLFYIDNTKTIIYEIPMNAPLDLSKIPNDTEWVLVIGDHKSPSNVKFKISMKGFYLIKNPAYISSIPYTVNFKSQDNNSLRFINSGFCGTESWGTWSCSKEASLSFNMKATNVKPLYMKLNFNVFSTKDYSQVFEYYLNGHLLSKKEYKKSPNQFAFNISNLIQKQNIFTIKIPKAITPKQLFGNSNDERQLGIGLISIELTNKKPTYTSDVSLIKIIAPVPSIPFIINFKSQDNNSQRYINSGFCGTESWGTWSCEKEAELSFGLKDPKVNPLYIKLTFNALTSPAHSQTFEFYLNGHLLGKNTYENLSNNQAMFYIGGLIKRQNTLTIKIPDAITPKSLGINNDTREIGIGLIELKFTKQR